MISGSSDRTIRHWNIDTDVAMPSHTGHKESVALLSISTDGRRVVSGTRDGELLLWDVIPGDRLDGPAALEQGTPAAGIMGSLSGHTHWVETLRITGDGGRVVTGSRDRTVRVWDVQRQTTLHLLKGHLSEVFLVDISADGRRCVSISRDRTLRVWDLQTGRCLRVLVYEGNDRVRSLLRVDDAMLAEMNLGPQLDIARKPIMRFSKIAISPDGQRVLVASQGNLCVWNLTTGTTRDQELGDFDIVAFAFQPDSQRVALGTLFGQILCWDFKREPVSFDGHRGRILDLVVGPDGKSLISAAKDDSIRTWDLDGFHAKRQLAGHSGRVDAVAIAAQGQVAYSVYGDTLVAFDLVLSARIGSLTFDHQITAIAVTPEGKRLVVGDQSGRVHFLSLQT